MCAKTCELRPLNTIHVDIGTEWRGGQGQALLLMQGLRERGHTVTLVAPAGSPLTERAAAAGIAVHTVTRSHARLHAAFCLRSLEADVVHSHDAHGLTAAWLAASHRRSKLVAARRLAYPLASGSLAQARYRRAHRIIAVSQFVRASVLDSGLPPQNVEVVYDGVEVPPLTSPSEKTAVRRLWTDAAEAPLIGCVGYLLPEKGQELLVRALPLVRRAYAGCRLVLAGDGPMRARLEQLALELGVAASVRFAGHVEKVAEVYRALDVFVFPSLAEPLGSSLLAAMASALACVGVARGAVPEILQDGQNGLTAPSPEPAEIAAAVVRLLEDPALARRLGAAARNTVEERFSAARMVEDTLNVYRRL